LDGTILPLGDKRTYQREDPAEDAPLAQALFAVEGVISVHFEAGTVTVFMDEEAEWDPIIDRVPGVITTHFEAGLPAVEGVQTAPPERKYSFGFRQVTGRPREEQMKIVQELLEKEINPAVASHGGFFTLIDVQENTVYVQLGGGCQGCGMVDVTLRQGVEQRMKEVLPEMVALVDTTDHASGNNPYYSPGK
jgi:Fe-S cluster biogenesis protein NfuA